LRCRAADALKSAKSRAGRLVRFASNLPARRGPNKPR
jgi:hypothetical protein